MLSDLPASARESIEVVAGNISDPFNVRSAVRNCDVVFHLAALIGIPYSYVAPSDYVSVNVQGTLNVLQACRDEQTPRLVHTSTSEAYGTAQHVPIDEEHPLCGQSPYSASKIAADKMAEAYHRSFELPVVTVRPFNTFGPRQSARAFIPTVISQALTRDRVRIGSQDPIRDMTYVKDTAQGLITVGISDNTIGQVVNLGAGHGESIGSMARVILREMGKDGITIEHDSARVRPESSEVLRLISDNSKAKRLTGWAPRISFEEGIRRTIEWIRANIHRYSPEDYTI
jgi:dTDP-glucose 4,6-dehydratase